MQFESAKIVIQTLKQNGHEAYIVGGYVRDLLLGLPSKDIDIVTSALPDQVISLFNIQADDEPQLVGKCFGVVVVKVGGDVFEVSTFRKDVGVLDGRHPERVDFTKSAEEDVKRRDFTINGLLYDVTEKRVIDHVGGIQDLMQHKLRFIGSPHVRIQEDYLRMLRAIRFATKYNFVVCSDEWEAILTNAHYILALPKERIFQEINKILLCPGRSCGVRLLHQSGLLKHILPDLWFMIGLQQPPEFHPEGDVFEHTCLLLDYLKPNASRELVWAALLHDVGKTKTHEVDEQGKYTFYGHDVVGAEMAESILRDLKADTQLIETVKTMVLHHMRFRFVQKMKRSSLAKFVYRPTFEEELELHRVDCLSSSKVMDNYKYLQPGGIRETLKLPPVVVQPLPNAINGDDLIALGLQPGPLFKQILSNTQNYLIDNSLPLTSESKVLALEYIQKEFNL